MYQRLLFFVLLLAALTNHSRAQGGAAISGIVHDSEGKVLSDATVTLQAAQDSSVIKLSLTDKEGRFHFPLVVYGRYFVSVSMVGFAPYTSGVLSVAEGGGLLRLPPITMQPQTAPVLQGVTVSAARALVERKTDRTVVNVDAMLSSTGSSALELLERAPGVSVDENGTVSLNGKAGVLVLIDDKPTYLSGEALANYLRSLPSSTLDKIELMPTPPARYDAAGNAGVINIRTKKSRAAGFNGSLSAAFNQGKLFSTTNSTQLNYKTGSLNLFGNFSYIRQHVFTDLDIHRRYFSEQGVISSYFSQNSYITRESHAFSGRAGADYSLNKRTSLSVVLSALERPTHRRTRNTSWVLDDQKTEDSVITADNRESSRWNNRGVNVNFRRDLDASGRTLTADLDHIRYTSGNHQAFYNTTHRPQSGTTSHDELRGSLPSVISIYASRLDYAHSLGKGLVAEGGAKTSYIHTDNLAEYFITEGGSTRPDYDKTNHFIYREQITAGYVNLNADGRRFSLKAGLRAEHTLSRGQQLGNAQKPDSSFRVPYTDLFPTLFVLYKLDSLSVHQLNLSYGRRIDRPVYQDLNPFISPLDKFTLYAGNPFLRPSFTNEVSLAYTYQNKVTTTLSYSETSDVAMEAIQLNGNNYLSQPANVGSNSILGLSVNAGLRPAKWWTLNTYAEVQSRNYEGELFRTRLDTSAVYFGTNVSNQLKLGKDWSAEVGGTYRTGVVVGQVSLASLWQLNAGVQKKVLASRGTVRLAVRDLFYSGIRNGIIHNLYRADATFRNKGDLRVYTLSFTYNFGKQAQERSRSRGSAQTEQNRVREG